MKLRWRVLNSKRLSEASAHPSTEKSARLQFPYGAAELACLKAADPLLGAFIDQYGKIERELQPDVFTALAQSLIAQQISNAAAVTVWRRLNERFGTLTPSGLMEADEAALQACGIPLRKAQWLRHLGTRIVEGALDFAALPGASDAAVIQTLTALPGVGVWTAEMLLIFALGRPDVVSWGDQAIRNGMMRLYGLEALNKAQFAHYRERYRPYGTVASFYLWALARS